MRKIDRILLILTLIAGVVSFCKAAVDYTRLMSPISVISLPADATEDDGQAQQVASKVASPCKSSDEIYLPSIPEWNEAYLLLESYTKHNGC